MSIFLMLSLTLNIVCESFSTLMEGHHGRIDHQAEAAQSSVAFVTARLLV